MSDRFDTAGEQLLGRPLARERVHGIERFRPGQHRAEARRDGTLAVSYVDSQGRACLIEGIWVDDEGWRPTRCRRAGILSGDPMWGRIPPSFRISDEMTVVLERARRERFKRGRHT